MLHQPWIVFPMVIKLHVYMFKDILRITSENVPTFLVYTVKYTIKQLLHVDKACNYICKVLSVGPS